MGKQQLQKTITAMSTEMEQLQKANRETATSFLSRQETWMNNSKRLLQEKQVLQDTIVKLRKEKEQLQKEKDEAVAGGISQKRQVIRHAREEQWKNSTMRLLSLKHMMQDKEPEPELEQKQEAAI